MAMWLRFLSLMSVFFLWTASVRAMEVKAPSAVLIETAGGRILYAKNPDERRAPASMTKLMTLLLAVKALHAGRVKWDEPVTADEEAVRLGGSQIWLRPGERLPLGDLVRAVAVGSANDAAYALGRHLAGSERAFVAEMNAEARRLGLKNTVFENSHGLDSPGHLTTARDMAILGREATRWPELLRLTSEWEDRSIRNGRGGKLWLVNHNRLLRRYPGLDGLKTGFTSRAGYCITATARRDGLRLVAVVMGDPTSRDRFRDAATLLDYGFARFQAKTLAAAGREAASAPVTGGMVRRVPLTIREPLVVTLPKGGHPSLRLVTEIPARLSAPLPAGRPAGWLVARDGPSELGRARLYTMESVRPLGPFGRLLRFLQEILRPA